MTRVEPGGSVFVCQTRWHPDDLSGVLIKRGWPYVKLPALDEAGTALWPERWPADALQKRREEVGPYVWASLYQGEPRPRGGAVFGDAWGYEKLPAQGYRVGIGLDLAFTKKTASDYSVLVVMLHHAGFFYVVDVVRAQTRAPDFTEVVRNYRT